MYSNLELKTLGKTETARFKIIKLLPRKYQVHMWVFMITLLNVQVSQHYRIYEY